MAASVLSPLHHYCLRSSALQVRRTRVIGKMAINGVTGVRPKHDIASLKVNQSRLMEAIHLGCEYGADHRYGNDPTETGMSRLSLNNADRSIRNWFKKAAEEVGCTVSVDQMGNQFAIRPGKSASASPIMMGSHLDTQPTGGRYDGILGVNAGLEVLRVLHENHVETAGNVGVVNWTNEEGARFPMMAVSSGVWAEAVPLDTAWNLKEVNAGEDGRKKTMKEELERIGYLGSLRASYRENPIAAHFELHIEQGPILENEKRKIGVVEGTGRDVKLDTELTLAGAQAFRWFEITVTGRDTHAGTTPMNARMDSMLCAAKLIVQSNAVAKKLGGLATTGVISGQPGSINTMAHTVTFTLDIRHTSDRTLAEMEELCRSDFARIAEHESERGCKVEWKGLVDSPAVKFHPECIAAVTASASEVCQDLPKTSEDEQLWQLMTSGAGHDSCYTNRRCPTSMIFTPTKDGVSHNPREYCSPEDCAIGAQVLLGAVLRYDRLRESRGDFASS